MAAEVRTLLAVSLLVAAPAARADDTITASEAKTDDTGAEDGFEFDLTKPASKSSGGNCPTESSVTNLAPQRSRTLP